MDLFIASTLVFNGPTARRFLTSVTNRNAVRILRSTLTFSIKAEREEIVWKLKVRAGPFLPQKLCQTVFVSLPNGNKTIELSADDILSCCLDCGFGCFGGFPISAWQYFVESGVVTGGRYGTKDACRPYEIPPCGHHRNETFYSNCTQVMDTPDCTNTCQAGYPISYDDDKTFGKLTFLTREPSSS
ncbi:hypothetical protein KIN20_016911 [Parelaphostrongylus tenuis]|uniref:Peptidase C1A papain C-terminal domain-containing protein n=1 Tax=Parelaphostrongylus tenuis TaxID=148309 RepID=A0AAD5QR31_PARTN|nr:hypothetical protein KIN20_016911 [Parelaphostrongylus tenuis]